MNTRKHAKIQPPQYHFQALATLYAAGSWEVHALLQKIGRRSGREIIPLS